MPCLPIRTSDLCLVAHTAIIKPIISLKVSVEEDCGGRARELGTAHSSEFKRKKLVEEWGPGRGLPDSAPESDQA